MPFCHFSKIFAGTTWEDIKVNNKLQSSKNCKMIEYKELAIISVEQSVFNLICMDISKPQYCYQKYCHESCADSTGKWNCIIIECIQTKQKIIMYTAGQTYPLYAAICEQ